MKLSNKLSIIAGLGAMSIVGTGFAAWYFNKDAEDQESVSNVIIEQRVDIIGTITVANTAKFTLDQDPASIGLPTIVGKVNWDGAITPTFTEEAEDGTPLLDTVTGTGHGVKLTWKAELAANLQTYIQFAADAEYTDVEWESGVAITLPALEFIDGKAPQSAKEYDTMKAAVTGGAITFTFSAKAID